MKSLLLSSCFLFFAVLCNGTLLNESFTDSAFPPSGWTLINGGNQATTWERYNGSYRTAPACIFIYFANGNVDRLTTPTLYPAYENHTFSFWYKMMNTTYTNINVRIFLFTSQDEYIGLLGTVPYTTTNYTQLTFDLTQYIGQSIKIGIQDQSNPSANGIYIDDIQGPETYPWPDPAISPFPADYSIEMPTNISLAWTLGGNNLEGSRLYLGTDGGGSATPTNFLNGFELGLSTSFNLNGWLEPGTTYYWRIVPYNSIGASASCPIWRFTTAVHNSFPYIQNFNSSSGMPYWTGSMSWGANHGTGPSPGLYSRQSSGAPTSYSVSPLIGLVSSGCILKFDYRMIDFTNYPSSSHVLGTGDNLQVLVSSDEGLSWNTILEINQTNHNTSMNFATKLIELYDYSGQYIKIKFVTHYGTGDWYCDIDNFSLTEDFGIYHFPYTQNFDYAPNWPYPGGWSMFDLQGSSWQSLESSENPFCYPVGETGSFAYYNSHDIPAGHSCAMILPLIHAHNMYAYYTLGFWMYRDEDYPSVPDRIEVYSANEATPEGQLLGTVYRSCSLGTPQPHGWQYYTFDLGVGIAADTHVWILGCSEHGNNINLDELTITETVITAQPGNPVVVYPANMQEDVPVNMTISWNPGSGYTANYHFFLHTDGNINVPNTTVCNRYIGKVTSYHPPTLYYDCWYTMNVFASNICGSSNQLQYLSFKTDYEPILMHNGAVTLTTDKKYRYFDSGGATGNYQGSESISYTFYPPRDFAIAIKFQSFNTESFKDSLTIYNGGPGSTDIITSLSGTQNPGIFYATNPGGALTLVFNSDIQNQAAGWDCIVYSVLFGVPQNLTLSHSGVLSWSAVPGSNVYYNIYSKDDPEGSYTYVGQTTSCSWTIPDLSYSHKFYIVKSDYDYPTSRIDKDTEIPTVIKPKVFLGSQ